jgi:hypothetical protein
MSLQGSNNRSLSSYRPTVAHQLSKLGSREGHGEWNLPGAPTTTNSRTRNGGRGRPDLTRAWTREPELLEDDGTEEEEEEEDEWDERYEEETVSENNNNNNNEDNEEDFDMEDKPDCTRVLMDVAAISDAVVDKHCRCVECNGPITMTFKHTCLASRVILSCNDANCGYVYNGFAKETLKEKKR